jgi:hypothetical protein
VVAGGALGWGAGGVALLVPLLLVPLPLLPLPLPPSTPWTMLLLRQQRRQRQRLGRLQ